MPVTKKEQRRRRRRRIRKKIWGLPDRPRLSVFRSNKHIYAQVIDDVNEVTLVAASSLDAEVDDELTGTDQAASVGELIAERAREAGIEQVVFDRSGYKYHGRVRTLAEAAREKGLDF